MLIVSEEICQTVVSDADAFIAVENVFAAMSRDDAYNFPVIREDIGYSGALYGFKSGFDRAGLTLGVKSGGYWPGNVHKNLTNHQSTVLLFDPDTGRPTALVGGNYLTAVRTAASSAISIARLSRPDSKVLGMVGAGHQAQFQLKAALVQREFEQVVAWNHHPENLPKLAAVADELGIAFEAVERKELGERADVIITISSSFEPQLMKEWIQPGTHLACMGTDTAGKQEVDAELVASALVFTDEVAQSVSIGEAQHAIEKKLLKPEEICPIGNVINGTHPGRTDENEITLFDGTGVGLQDLVVAKVAAEAALSQGLGLEAEV